MSKKLTAQRFIYKINSARLRKAKWALTLPLVEARRNDEIISIASSMILRKIDELNGVVDMDARAMELKRRIRSAKKEADSVENRRYIKELYAELDKVQFKPDYMCLVIEKEKDYYRACKGFTINGIKYTRLLGTNGGIKNSTIVFVSERLHDELCRWINNGRRMDIPLVPAKLEAYRALVCSGSEPVSMPRGVAVVDDCVTHFREDAVFINDENDGEPEVTYVENAELELDESDGYGLMSPALAQRWSEELGLDYVAGAFCTRAPFSKGMIFAFDFLDFADKVAGKRVIKDAWGDEIDLSEVELILTTSMLKLWDFYGSCEEYLRCCAENGYTFGITKEAPRALESFRTTNYQFVNCQILDDDDIDELIEPTVKELHEILRLDWRKTVLFLKGGSLETGNVESEPADFAKALMIAPEVLNDKFVRKKILYLIEKRIRDAKIGVLNVHGNYSMVCGDPYALCQNMFGLEVTGLLKAGELYNRYWADTEAEKVACFRAPMTSLNNVALLSPCRSEEAAYWYQHIPACTMLNAWDSTCHRLNGMDKDGDLVMITDNDVLVSKFRREPTIMCLQRKAKKIIPTEDDLIQSNIVAFGDEIGKITNRATSMFDVRAQYEPGSKEYDMLTYRIMTAQNYQQNSIDKAKGIIAKPMPRNWYDRHSASAIEDDEEREFYLSIIADKKPYFMRYIYPDLMKRYNTYLSNTDKKCLREFRMSVGELLAKPEDELSGEEKEFLFYYNALIPVGNNDCVGNRICRKVEDQFDRYLAKHKDDHADFDYSIFKSGCEYTNSQRDAIDRIRNEYFVKSRTFVRQREKRRYDEDADRFTRKAMIDEFRAACEKVCSNAAQLCDIVLDVCYAKDGYKQFAWDMVGEQMVENLLMRSGGLISYPVPDENGELEFRGRRFSFVEKGYGELV